MEGNTVLDDGTFLNLAIEVNLKDEEEEEEEEEEEFRSCYEDEEELKEREESAKLGLEEASDDEAEENKESENGDSEEELDESCVKLYFKGTSISGIGLSGIGVVLERCGDAPIQVQKKLDFYVQEPVADYLALMDGLSEAVHNKIRRVYAFTDSEILYNQIMHEDEGFEDQLLMALRQRVLEYANGMEVFVLKFFPNADVARALELANVAIGLVSPCAKGDESTESCSICCEDKLASMMVTFKCLHKFCSHCMKTYVEGKIQSTQIPIRCPQLRCNYYISATECKCFLPVASYEMLERALAEANLLNPEKMYCPYPNCLVLLDPHECSSTHTSSSSQANSSCVECPVCQRFFCVDCRVPWHSSMICDGYQNLPLEERNAGDITLHCLAQNKRWRHCLQCQRMVEVTHCYHMTCLSGQQTCQYAFWNEDYSEELITHPTQQFEQWAWDSFESPHMMMDAYSDQERSQLALIQRFLAGGFDLTDHQSYQSPPRCTDSYGDAVKDLNLLPWLEQFVSVISDNYYEDYIQ